MLLMLHAYSTTVQLNKLEASTPAALCRRQCCCCGGRSCCCFQQLCPNCLHQRLAAAKCPEQVNTQQHGNQDEQHGHSLCAQGHASIQLMCTRTKACSKSCTYTSKRLRDWFRLQRVFACCSAHVSKCLLNTLCLACCAQGCSVAHIFVSHTCCNVSPMLTHLTRSLKAKSGVVAALLAWLTATFQQRSGGTGQPC
jgi:hypothetical protein